MTQQHIIYIHPDAPPKPAEGQPCNGCGVCCLSAPCPIGILVSRRRQGACTALQWSEDDRRYVCGMLTAPLQSLGWRGSPEGAVARNLARLVSGWSSRWIAAGIGCDSSLLTGKPAEADSEPGQATRLADKNGG